ncbi:hypothetical protein VCX44_23380, partial [Aeromonas caviae]
DFDRPHPPVSFSAPEIIQLSSTGEKCSAKAFCAIGEGISQLGKSEKSIGIGIRFAWQPLGTGCVWGNSGMTNRPRDHMSLEDVMVVR